MNKKANYTGLLTQRQQVECEPLMKASEAKAKIKVKSGGTTEEWVPEDGGPLDTSITTDFGG